MKLQNKNLMQKSRSKLKQKNLLLNKEQMLNHINVKKRQKHNCLKCKKMLKHKRLKLKL